MVVEILLGLTDHLHRVMLGLDKWPTKQWACLGDPFVTQSIVITLSVLEMIRFLTATVCDMILNVMIHKVTIRFGTLPSCDSSKKWRIY